jgi:hypothetical protein
MIIGYMSTNKKKNLCDNQTDAPRIVSVSNITQQPKSKVIVPIDINADNEYVKNYSMYNRLTIESTPNSRQSSNYKTKYNCDQCPYTCDGLDDLEKHLKLVCKANKYYRTIYNLDPKTFGVSIFGEENSGDIYLIQNNFENDNEDDDLLIKVGGTNWLYRRLSNYRTPNGYEPRLHCYFPVKNWPEAEGIIKKKLAPFNTNGEIYEGSVTFLRKAIRDILKKEYGDDFHEYEPDIKYGDVVQCDICRMTFKTFWAYEKHLIICELMNHDIRHADTFVCGFCGIDFSDDIELLHHQHTDVHIRCNTMSSIIYNQNCEERTLFEKLFSQFRSRINNDTKDISINTLSFSNKAIGLRDTYLKLIPEMKSLIRSKLRRDIIVHSQMNDSNSVSNDIEDLLSTIEIPKYFRFDTSHNIESDIESMKCVFCLKKFKSGFDLVYHEDICPIRTQIWTMERLEIAIFRRIFTEVWLEMISYMRSNRETYTLLYDKGTNILTKDDTNKSKNNKASNRKTIISKHRNTEYLGSISNCITVEYGLTCEYCGKQFNYCAEDILHAHRERECTVKLLLEYEMRMSRN